MKMISMHKLKMTMKIIFLKILNHLTLNTQKIHKGSKITICKSNVPQIQYMMKA